MVVEGFYALSNSNLKVIKCTSNLLHKKLKYDEVGLICLLLALSSSVRCLAFTKQEKVQTLWFAPPLTI